MKKGNEEKILSGAIAILGSGETSPNLVSVHREMINRLEKINNPLIFNSPFGFQENVNELSDKLKKFYKTSLRIDTEILSYKNPSEINTVDYFNSLDKLNKSNFVFAGPGSPSYAIKVWGGTEFPSSLNNLLKNNGSIIFSSAAATTLGKYTLPVYEIYKVGEEPYWIKGLDILGSFGINASIIPHFNNKEGGNHDTRFCYMGEDRFNTLRSLIDSNIIGIDEHTGLVIDGKTCTGKVFGIGVVTLISGENKNEYIAGETISFDHFTALDANETNKVIPLNKESIKKDINIDEASSLIIENEFNQESINRILSKIKINLDELENKTEILDPLVNLIIEVRESIREQGGFELSDYIRDELDKLGIEVKDSSTKTAWKFKA